MNKKSFPQFNRLYASEGVLFVLFQNNSVSSNSEINKPVKMVVDVKVENVDYFGHTSDQESDVSTDVVESSDDSDSFRIDCSNRWEMVNCSNCDCSNPVF
jgi:hypothetical protein